MVAFANVPVLVQLLVFATMAAASPLPLNINLGAYSPAIVVGDGAIEFDETKTKTNAAAVLASASGQEVNTIAPSESAGAVNAVIGSSDPSILTDPASVSLE